MARVRGNEGKIVEPAQQVTYLVQVVLVAVELSSGLKRRKKKYKIYLTKKFQVYFIMTS